MVKAGDVIPWSTVVAFAGLTSRKGMQFRPGGGTSTLLMSRRADAPYADELADDGQGLVYIGHDDSPSDAAPDPRFVDQPLERPNGRPSDNAIFLHAVEDFKNGKPAERVRVFEKVQTNIWVFNGEFALVDAWSTQEAGRRVFKFKLRLVDGPVSRGVPDEVPNPRIIPSKVKFEVWKRDQGRCVLCGRTENLHYDHELPFSRGGSSLVAANIRILCARHNLAKGAKIE